MTPISIQILNLKKVYNFLFILSAVKYFRILRPTTVPVTSPNCMHVTSLVLKRTEPLKCRDLSLYTNAPWFFCQCWVASSSKNVPKTAYLYIHYVWTNCFIFSPAWLARLRYLRQSIRKPRWDPWSQVRRTQGRDHKPVCWFQCILVLLSRKWGKQNNCPVIVMYKFWCYCTMLKVVKYRLCFGPKMSAPVLASSRCWKDRMRMTIASLC